MMNFTEQTYSLTEQLFWPTQYLSFQTGVPSIKYGICHHLLNISRKLFLFKIESVYKFNYGEAECLDICSGY